MAGKTGHVKGMLPARIIEALNYTGEWMSVRTISEFLGEDRNIVHGIVARLYAQGEIDRRMHWIGKQRFGKPYIWQYRSLEAEE